MYKEEVKWPDGKKNAVMVSVNLDAEYWGIFMYPDTKPEGSGFEEMAKFGMEKGLERLLETFDKYHIKATFFVPGIVAEKYKDSIEMIKQYGHEFGVHGYQHENFGLLSVEEQEKAMKKSIEAVETVSGQRPVGFRAPEGELTAETFEIAKKCGICYSSTLGNDDRPYFYKMNDTDSILEIPFHWAMADTPYFDFHFWPQVPYGQDRISCFKKVLTNWKWEYDVFREEGLCYVLSLNPMTIADPGKIYILEDILEYIQKDSDVWFATGREIYEFYQNK